MLRFLSRFCSVFSVARPRHDWVTFPAVSRIGRRGCIFLEVVLTASAVLWSGCATTCPAATMNLTLAASDRLNVDDQGRSLATVVRVYQLKSAEKLAHAEFEDIWQRANETLAGDLVKVDEFTLFPNDKMDKPLTLEKDTAFVAAVALVRKPGGVSWRSIYALPSTQCNWLGHPPHLARRFVLQDYSVASVAP